MQGGFPIDLILFAMVAAFLVLRLRSVLGRRTGFERPPEARPAAGYPPRVIEGDASREERMKDAIVPCLDRFFSVDSGDAQDAAFAHQSSQRLPIIFSAEPAQGIIPCRAQALVVQHLKP